jgi:hypothetical protein
MSVDSGCPPKRKDYPDVQSYFKAIHKCNQEKVKNMNISENTNPDFCPNRNTMKEKDGDDKLIKFINTQGNTQGNIHCMYVSEFKMHIQNICNIYTQWTCVNKNLCDQIDENTQEPDTSGRGYAPKVQAYDLLGILKFTNHCCIINDIYWSVPLFSKGLLSMKTIIKIQETVKQNKNKNENESESEYEIKVKPITKSKDDFRLGNIYGTFGIGQTHAQADPTTFYVIDDSELDAATMTDCNLQPDNDFFAFENMEKKLSLQLEIKDLINNLYNRPLDLYNDEELKKFFLTDEKFKEEDICPDTETVVQLFFMYYNNEILIPGLDDKESEAKITENMTLKEMRKTVNENQEMIEEQNQEKNNASSDDIASSEDLMNMSIPDSPMNMNMNMNTPEHFTQGTQALFSGSPMSPINGRELDTSTRSDYDIALGNESTYINRTPISPMMQRLSMSDLVGNTPESATYDNRSVNNSDNDQIGRMLQDQGPIGNLGMLFDGVADETNDPTTPIIRRGGRKTFNRKKKPKKNKTKKKKRTRKRNKI